LQQNFVDDQIAIFKSLAARNATFLLALILIASPVIGLRPMRAAGLRATKMTSPMIFTRSPFFQVLGDHADEVFQHLQALLLAELMLFRKHGRQMPGGHRLVGLWFG
jgi:hypothetical protein